MSGGCNLSGDVRCEMEHFKGAQLSVAFDEPIAHPRLSNFPGPSAEEYLYAAA
jgi:hypothetical protein